MSEGMARHRQLNGGVPRGWRSVHPNPIPVERDLSAPEPTIYAIVSTWHDGDVIEATVRNAFGQGASRVFILDNASPDNTVEVAKGAGAEIAEIYQTDFYDEDWRITLQNNFIREQTIKAALPELWWMVLDADELPLSLAHPTLADAVRGLPRDIRVVGTDFIDLYPTGKNQNVPGQHPALGMTQGHWRRGGGKWFCQCNHWKHSLIRLFNGERDLAMTRGNHTVAIPGDGGEALMNSARLRQHGVQEPDFDLVTFHAPIRRECDARARLTALCGSGRSQWDDEVIRKQGAIKRWQSLDNIFAGRWDQVEMPHSQVYGRPIRGLALYPWRRLLKGFDEARLLLERPGVSE